MLDKFHDECGVVAIYGHPEASKLAYLGLYALQHRGQESAGICTYGGGEIHSHKSMGHVADIFTSDVLATLPGEVAIGHTRYSTAGDTVLLNAQPFSVVCNKGQIGGGAQRQHHQCRGTARRTGPPWRDFPGVERHRGDSAPGGAFLGTHADRRPARRLASTGGRVFPGIFGAGPHYRGARSAWFSPTGSRRNGILGRPQVPRICLRNLRLRPDWRGLPARCSAGRDGEHWPRGHHPRVLGPQAAALPVCFRARLFFAARLDRVRPCGGGIARESRASFWRANVQPMRTWWFRFPIPACPLRSATRTNRGCRFARH